MRIFCRKNEYLFNLLHKGKSENNFGKTLISPIGIFFPSLCFENKRHPQQTKASNNVTRRQMVIVHTMILNTNKNAAR